MNPSNQDNNQFGAPQPEQPQYQQPLQPQPEQPAPATFEPMQPQFGSAPEPVVAEQPQPSQFQPQPAVMPVQPMQPMSSGQPQQPVQPQVSAQAAPQPTKPATKNKLIILISAIVLAVILIGAGVFAYIQMTTVSQADFTEAYNLAKEVEDPSKYKLKADSVDVSVEESRNKQLAALRESITKYNDSLDKLANSKAIKHDKQAAELYAPIQDNRAGFNASVEAAYETVEKIMPALMSSPGKVSMASAVPKLKEVLPTLKDDANRKFVEQLIPVLERYGAVQEKFATKYDSSLLTEMRVASEDMSKVMNEWQDTQSERVKKVDVSGKMNALVKYLKDKSGAKS